MSDTNDLIRLNTIVYTTLEIVRKISFLLYPIIPESSLKALKIFNLFEKDINIESIKDNEFLAKDKSGQLVFLADSSFTLEMTKQKYPSLKFHYKSEF